MNLYKFLSFPWMSLASVLTNDTSSGAPGVELAFERRLALHVGDNVVPVR